MIGDLNPAVWRIDVYELKPASPFTGAVTDLSQLYTSDLTIKKERNKPDEIHFTLDLQQLEERADSLNTESHTIIEPYRHKVLCFRNGEFVAQGIIVKVETNLNNQSKNTIEVSCVDTLGLFEKRLINQDYGEGSWADFAKQVVYDAQHEPNRIYNYAWEGDGTGIDNAWFRGWKYRPGDELLALFPEWEPNKLYSMYDKCTHGGKFWEAKEHAFYSGETFSESNWTLLGLLDPETGEVAPAYGVWREDDEEPGPTGTALGGWGGTSSCHMTASSFKVNNGGSITSISMKDSTVSTSLVAPFDTKSLGTGEIFSRVMARDANAKYEITNSSIANKTRFKSIDTDKFKDELFREFPNFLSDGDFVSSIVADDNGDDVTFKLKTKKGKTLDIWSGNFYTSGAKIAMERWGITLATYYTLTFSRNNPKATGSMQPMRIIENGQATIPTATYGEPKKMYWLNWNTKPDGTGKTYKPGDKMTITGNTTLYAIWEVDIYQFALSYKPSSSSQWITEEFPDDLNGLVRRMKEISAQYEQSGTKYDIKIMQNPRKEKK